MLTHEEALKEIQKNAKPLAKIRVPLAEALGCVLAEDIKAPLPFPHFDNSAVDGFAYREHPLTPSLLKRGMGELKRLSFNLVDEIAAGNVSRKALKPGEAAAVFTGAPVPRGTQAVVMQEHAVLQDGIVTLKKEPAPGANIRKHGEDFQKGDLLILKMTLLAPQHIGLLAALGHSRVSIFRRPNVGILSTGNELIAAGKKLKAGQIYDSNTPLVEALVRSHGAVPASLSKIGDGLSATRAAIRKGLGFDVLILCGGVSVGKYDFVKEALEKEGAREIFWKVDIKPGKPLYFGRKGKTLIFGLPGNPVSVYVTFEEFVKPALFALMGKRDAPREREGLMTLDFENGPRPHFVRIVYEKNHQGYRVTPLKGQGSHQIGSLAKANAILKMDPFQKLKARQSVRVKIMEGAAL